ncbi:MAG: hypothetical protein IPN77_16930 [Sandaracinaceae bacterium]|nr:hypothetical protein [Sandaracinaceae bacterium]
MMEPGGVAQQAEQELALLRDQIAHHEKLYRKGTPEIPDGAFDELFDRYQELADSLGVPTEERIDRSPGVDHTDGFRRWRTACPCCRSRSSPPTGATRTDSPCRTRCSWTRGTSAA